MCVRPSKLTYPSFSVSLGFPLCSWCARWLEKLWGQGACPCVVLGAAGHQGWLWARSWICSVIQAILLKDICLAGWDAQARGSKQSKHVWLCVCLHVRAQRPCLRVSDHKGRGIARGHQPSLAKGKLIGIVYWGAAISTQHPNFYPCLILVWRLRQPSKWASPQGLLWMPLEEWTSREALRGARGIASPAGLISLFYISGHHHIHVHVVHECTCSLLLTPHLPLFHLLTYKKWFLQLDGFCWKHSAHCRVNLQHFPSLLCTF